MLPGCLYRSVINNLFAHSDIIPCTMDFWIVNHACNNALCHVTYLLMLTETFLQDWGGNHTQKSSPLEKVTFSGIVCISIELWCVFYRSGYLEKPVKNWFLYPVETHHNMTLRLWSTKCYSKWNFVPMKILRFWSQFKKIDFKSHKLIFYN